MFNDFSKVKEGWSQVFGGGQLCFDAAVRVAIRKDQRKEPSSRDLRRFVDGFTPYDYVKLVKTLGADFDKSFCAGEEVCLMLSPQPWI